MLHIYDDTIIYVHAPAGVVTGGVELLHQLVDFLRTNGKEAYIVYFGKEKHVLPKDYLEYNISISENIIDSERNIEVFTETMVKDLIENMRHTQKFLWWLSVDNYYNVFPIDLMPLQDIWEWYPIKTYWDILIYRTRRLLHGFDDFHSCISIFKKQYHEIDCGYQSEYIHDFLRKKGFSQLMPLKDYINVNHFYSFSKDDRNNIVLYNPSKRYEYTQKLIELSPDLKWVALKGMSREKLIETIRSAKVYVDFGNHPGKDRLPRECAINGCCIITGMRGAAGFFEDVPINKKYKLNETTSSLESIIKLIRWTLSNYETAIDDFSYYRNIIKQEQREFERQVRCVFCVE